MPTVPPISAPSTRRRGSSSRKFLWLATGTAATGVVALFAGQAWLETYLRGDAFRGKTEAALGRALHARAQLGPIDRQGIAVSSESLQMDGESGAYFKTAKLHGLWAELDLAAVWHRLWKVDSLRFQRMELDLDAAPPGTAQPGGEAAPSPPAPWWSALLPHKTHIASVQTDRATLTRSGMELRESRVTAKPQEGSWDITLESGSFHAPDLPAMDLSNARFITQAGGGVLRGARLLVKSGGQINLTGEWSAKSGLALHSQLENVDAQPFLPVWWQTRLHGTVFGNLKFVKDAARPDGELSGDLRIANGRLEALPLLTELGTFIGNPRFRQVPLKSATARLIRTPTRTELQNLDMDADGVLRLRGDIVVDHGNLKGSLKLGVSPALVQWLTSAKSQIFSESKEGYVWVAFELTGTPEQPVENLSARLLNGAVEAITEKVKALPGAPPAGVPEAAKGLLDAVKSLIPGR